MTKEQGTGTLHNHMLVWLYNFKPASKLKSLLEDESFWKHLKNYLDNIIKQGYLESVTIDENVKLDVSEASYRHPIDPDDYEDPHDFEIR